MENDKEKWFEEVLGSMKGSQKAQPRSSLFAQIESKLDAPTTEIIPIHQWRTIAASAILLFILNFYAAYEFNQSLQTNTTELETDEMYNYQVISDYKIYE